MDKKTVAIIVTVAAVLLCGCPGLLGVFGGGLFAIISFIPGANIDVGGNTSPQSALTTGLIGLCGGLIFVLIAAIAIYLVWRRNKGDSALPPSA